MIPVQGNASITCLQHWTYPVYTEYLHLKEHRLLNFDTKRTDWKYEINRHHTDERRAIGNFKTRFCRKSSTNIFGNF